VERGTRRTVCTQCGIKSSPSWSSGTTDWSSDFRPVGRGFDSRLNWCWCVPTLGKLFTPVCPCHQAVQFGTGQRSVTLCGWEGNRRPCVTDFSGLSMGYRPTKRRWAPRLRSNGIRNHLPLPIPPETCLLSSKSVRRDHSFSRLGAVPRSPTGCRFQQVMSFTERAVANGKQLLVRQQASVSTAVEVSQHICVRMVKLSASRHYHSKL